MRRVPCIGVIFVVARVLLINRTLSERSWVNFLLTLNPRWTEIEKRKRDKKSHFRKLFSFQPPDSSSPKIGRQLIHRVNNISTLRYLKFTFFSFLSLPFPLSARLSTTELCARAPEVRFVNFATDGSHRCAKPVPGFDKKFTGNLRTQFSRRLFANIFPRFKNAVRVLSPDF